MFPFLIRQGEFSIPTFSFMLMVASLVATFYAYYRAPAKGLSQTVVLDLGIIGTLAAIVGGRLFHVFVEEPRYYFAHPERIYQIWNGGFVSYGAFILMGLCWYIYLKRRKLNVLKYFDLTALIYPIVIFFVRIGCLGAGCCYGRPTDFFIHLTFKSGDAGFKYFGIPLHATQAYAILNAVFLFIVLHLIDKKKKFDGQVASSFLILYGILRGLFEEMLRGDVERGLYLHGLISTGQIMSLLAVFVGIWLYWHWRRLAMSTGTTK